MIEPLDAMPDGTIGFRATGRVTRDEYRAGHPAAGDAGRRGGRRLRMFAWLTPGEIMVRDLDGLEEPRVWVAG
jgi:hypothetical protein